MEYLHQETFDCLACGVTSSHKGMWRHVQGCKSWDETKFGPRKTFSLEKAYKMGLYAEDLILGKDYVVCAICDVRLLTIVLHLKKEHQLTTEEYTKKHPGCRVSLASTLEKREQTNLAQYGVSNALNLNNGGKAAQSAEAVANRKATNLARYGCENPFGNLEIQKQIERTNLERYGTINPAMTGSPVRDQINKTISERTPEEIQAQVELTKQTYQKNWGADHPMQTEAGKQLVKDSLFEKHGVTNPMAVPGATEKCIESNKANHGGKHSQQCPEVRELAKQTWLETLGVDNPAKSPKVQEKTRQTFMMKYGVPRASQAESVKQKIRETNQALYGVDWVLESSEIQKKIRAVWTVAYGSPNPASSEKVRAKYRETCLERYGVDNARKAESIKAQIKQSTIESQGSAFPEFLPKNLCQSPNQLEMYASTLFPSNVMFVGDWVHTIRVGDKIRNPDFIVLSEEQTALYREHGQTKLLKPSAVIEVLGSYFHSEKFTGMPNDLHEAEMQSFYTLAGLPCLILWEHQIRKELPYVKEALEKFMKCVFPENADR